MDQMVEKIYSFCVSARPFVTALVCVALLVVGIMLIYPRQKTKEAAKDALPGIAIGCAIALAAVEIGTWFGSFLGF